MKLLLHACCGPCSLEPVRLLREEGHDLTIYYANSNIAPAAEYERRRDTLRAWAEAEGVPVLEGLYEPAAWEACCGRAGDAALAEARSKLEAAARRETDDAAQDDGLLRAAALAVDPAAREERCRQCYRLRFEETALAAAAGGFDAIGTTLSVSPYQYTQVIRQELEAAADRFGVGALFEDYRPFYDAATRLSRERGMYRQNYCGCRLSALEAAAEREERKAARDAARKAKQEACAEARAAREAELAAKRAERAAYDRKQARKRAVLKALREAERAQTTPS